MKIIVGLGNPGGKYENTRHNVGWLVLDQLVKEWGMGFKLDKKTATLRTLKKTESTEIILAKPLTFMNKSGKAVKRLLQYNNCLYLVHDDLDIPLGKYKIQLGKGPREHGGVESVEKTLGTKDFWRVRIGVENRDSENRISGEKYVLQEFTKEEKKIIDGVILEVVGEIKKRLCQDRFKTIS